jgi:cephalosporin hydroxylase
MSMKLLLLFVSLFYSVYSNTESVYQDTKIKIYGKNSFYFDAFKQMLDTGNRTYELTSKIYPHDHDLYILFDAFILEPEDLPEHYIVYQTLDFRDNALTPKYRKILAGAVAIWDYSQENIAFYKNIFYHYFYFPAHYEFADSVLVSCDLPKETLTAYKDLVAYSNKNNSDISSHLPVLFAYALTYQPKLIVEAGVRGGESTLALLKAVSFYDAQLIGIDIDPASAVAYGSLPKTLFLPINDLNFTEYYYASQWKHQKIDMVFIDTSHLYEHTMQEIKMFVPLLSEEGALIFHDSNVTPLQGGTAYVRLNGTVGRAFGNTNGVTVALKEYFGLQFDENSYNNFDCTKEGIEWRIVHYPFCNGLTIAKKLRNL